MRKKSQKQFKLCLYKAKIIIRTSLATQEQVDQSKGKLRLKEEKTNSYMYELHS